MGRASCSLALGILLAACGGADPAPTPGPAPGPSTSRSLASWPELRGATPAQGGGEKDAAIIVGIEDYAFVADVPGAEDNARDWYWYLTQTRQVPAERVRLLVGAQGTHDRILQTARKVAAEVPAGGTLWFVFIGHGAPSKDGKDGVLVGVDAQQDADGLYSRSLRQGALVEALGSGRNPHVVGVVDACFSGRSPSGAPLVAGLQPLIPVRARDWPDKGMAWLTAGGPNEFAGPLPKLGRPAFSYLILGALRGWGDGDGDGIVRADEAVGYARSVLAATLSGRTQTPEVAGSSQALALAQGAREAAPDLAAIMVGRAPVAANPTGAGEVRPVESVRAACKAGVQDACGELGWRLYNAEGVPRDLGRGVEMMQQACDRGVGEICVRLAELVPKRAKALWPKACTGGSARGCAELARAKEANLRFEPEVGEVARLYKKACTLGGGSPCVAAAKFERFGEGGVETVGAADLLQKACDGGDSRACLYLLVLRGKSKIVVDVDPIAMKAACDAGDRLACVVMVVRPAIVVESFEEASKRADVAEVELERLCAGGLTDACALMWRASDDSQLASMARGCLQSKQVEACTLLADAAETSEERAKAVSEALEMFYPGQDKLQIGLYEKGCYQATAQNWLSSLSRSTHLRLHACEALVHRKPDARAAKRLACRLRGESECNPL